MSNFITRFFERRRMEREGQLGTRKRRTDSLWGESADRSPVLTIALVVLMLGVCIAVLSLSPLHKAPLPIKGQIAPETIFSRVDFAYEDKAATAENRDKAAQKQPTYFSLSEARSNLIRQRLDNLYTALRGRLEAEGANQVYTGSDKALSQETAALSPTAFLALSRLERTVDPMLRQQFRDELERLLLEGIVNPELIAKSTANSQIRIVDKANRERWQRTQSSIITSKQAAERLTDLILSYSPELKTSALDRDALNRLMVALVGKDGNLDLDINRTRAQKEEAGKKVPPVMVDVKKNDILVKRSTEVTQKMRDALETEKAIFQEMNNQQQDKWQNIVRNAVWSLILVIFAAFYLVHIHPEITRSSRRIAMIVTIASLALGINYLAREAFYILSGALAIPPSLLADALPLALPAVLLTVMAGLRVALYIGFFTSMVTALMLNGSFNVALEGFILSALCGLLVRPATNYRSFFLRTFLCVSITVWGLDFNVFWHVLKAPSMLLFSLLLALGNGLFTAVAAMLLTFLFELMFNVSTNMSLMVLCDGNHPLLKELHMKAPGTFMHSQNVALLAEDAAEEIDANAVLARAGALFHDIGKINNPEYFIENNQTCSNPHNRLNPRMSSLIISSHVKDGLDMALKHKLCRSVRQFIQQHHGNDLIQYFYHKATTTGEKVVEEDYRYPGPLPHQKEVVIVSLADACEAASRSLEKPTPSKIETLVCDIFRKRWRDGQLDEANLTVEELSLINESFVRTLTTMYHGRVAYPKDENSNEDNVLIPERPASGTES